MDESQSSGKHLPKGQGFYCGPIRFKDPMGRILLNGVTLKIDKPSVTVIKGPSGAGKTTLLRAIVGLNKAKVEKRILDGTIYPERRLTNWRTLVTLLLQDAPVISGTIRDNLSFPFSFKNSPRKGFPEDEAVRLLDQMGLGHFGLHHQVDGLSGGERHRLGLVRGLLWAPPVLLADEPLSGLEPELAQQCFDMLFEFSRKRRAIVVCVLHEERFSKQSDLVMRLTDGTLHRT